MRLTAKLQPALPPSLAVQRGPANGRDATGRYRTGLRHSLTLTLILFGLLALLALSLSSGDTPSVSAQTDNSVTVPVSLSVPEETATFNFILNGDPGADVEVHAVPLPGVAGPRNRLNIIGCADDVQPDYIDVWFRWMLTAGSSSHQLPVISICDDDEAEEDETFTINVFDVNGVLDPDADNCQPRGATRCTTTITIVDDDRVIGVPSDWPLRPSGVASGGRFRLLFITSTMRTATSGHIRDYNAFVQERAAAGHSAIQDQALRFRAVGCTEGLDAVANANLGGAGVPIYYLNGNKIADDYSDFLDGSWDETSGLRDENGAAITVSNIEVWSGCNDDGTAETATPLGASNVSLSYSWSGGLDANYTIPGSNPRQLYGLSPVFRVDGGMAGDPTANSVTVPATVSVPEEAGAFGVTLTGDPGANVSVTVSFADGTATGGGDCATSGVDFDNDAPASQTVFSQSSTGELPVITICGDTTADAGETFEVTFTAASGVFDANAANCSSATVCATTVTIVDDDAAISVPPDWPLKPGGVAAGDRFRLLFVTSTIRNAQATDIRDYNTFVQDLAGGGHSAIQTHALGFRAVGCTQVVNAVDNANLGGVGVPIYYLNGNKMADNYGDFLDGGWDERTTGRYESGQPFSYRTWVWTGCLDNGTVNPGRHLGSSTLTRISHPFAGGGGLRFVVAGGSAWIHHLYGLSPVFRVQGSNSEQALRAASEPEYDATCADNDHKVGGLTLDGVSQDGFIVSWTALDCPGDYLLRYWQTDDRENTFIEARRPRGQTYYIAEDLAPGTGYTLRVLHQGPDGGRPWWKASPHFEITTLAP